MLRNVNGITTLYPSPSEALGFWMTRSLRADPVHTFPFWNGLHVFSSLVAVIAVILLAWLWLRFLLF